jgi:gluconolactonase
MLRHRILDFSPLQVGLKTSLMKKTLGVLPIVFVLAGCVSGGMPSRTAAQSPTASARENSLAAAIAPPTADFSQNFRPVRAPGDYQRAEGPAAGPEARVYFSDITAGKIYRWTPDGETIFREGLSDPNGLAFDRDRNLIACESGEGRLISIDPDGRITVLVDRYNGIRFNEPNDLWIDPQGGIYFSDPAYRSPVVQDGEDVYYLSPDRSRVTRVVADLVKPNGLAGTPDGKTFYVADWGAGRTYAYEIQPDGSLSGKRLFTSSGSDGMTLDAQGNLYLTVPNRVDIYQPDGVRLAAIPLPETPTNVEFTGADDRTLFITTQISIFIVQMST